MLHPNGDSLEDSFQGLHRPTSRSEEEIKGRDSLQLSHQKSPFLSTVRSGNRQNKCALQQVISARQQKIYEQQCEIEDLRRRVREVSSDNKFLREQNYWQTKALEKLDGKHAELPQLINGHLEEVRVYREQIKRMKEVLKLEKQRRHDAESTKEKVLYELKHLRKLAEENKLLEREDLMQTIHKLQTEAREREKLMLNLERYAENLEKNQRFESLRASKTQRTMRDTCQQLLDKIQELEQTVQEKQKIIELGNIYSQRGSRTQSIGGQLESHNSSNQLVTSHLETMVMNNEAGQNKGNLRERIRVFDQKRQDMVRKRERIRRKRQQQMQLGDTVTTGLTLNTMAPDQSTRNITTAGLNETLFFVRPCSARLISDKSESAVLSHLSRPKSSLNLVVLPKIQSSMRRYLSEFRSNKRSRSSSDSKQVRFCNLHKHKSENPENKPKELNRAEQEPHMLAEVHMESDPKMISSLSVMQTRTSSNVDPPVPCVTPEITTQLQTIGHLTSCRRTTTPKMTTIKLTTSVQEDESPTPEVNDRETPSNKAPMKDKSESNCEAEQRENLNKPIEDGTNILKINLPEHCAQTLEVNNTTLTCQLSQNSPQSSQAAQDHSMYDSFGPLSMPKSTTAQICRPCGDQDIDGSLLGEISGDSPCSSDAMAMGVDEDFFWPETPSVVMGSSLANLGGTSRVYRGPTGLVANAVNETDNLEAEYIAETPFGYLPEQPVDCNSSVHTKNNLPLLNCSARTTTLYTMINNSAGNEKTLNQTR